MGYCTCFSLEVNTADNSRTHPNEAAIIAQLREENEEAHYALDELGATETDAKWYEHEAELKEFSKKFPDALFTLHGDGEGGDDFWYEYFRNGQVQVAPGRIEYDEFDENKLG